MNSQSGIAQSSSRRSFISGAGALAATVALGVPAVRARAAQAPVVLVSWGGFLSKAIKEAWSDPFTKETGIPVVLAEGPDLAKVKAQIMTGSSDWDVIDLPGSMAAAGSKAGYWVPIDRGIVDTSQLLVQSKTPDLVCMYTYAGGVGWDSGRFPSGKHPGNFAEFFDTALGGCHEEQVIRTPAVF